MNHNFLLLLLLSIIFSVCQQKAHDRNLISPPMGPFFGITPDTIPQVLLPEFVSTRFGEYNGTFSPDGRTFFYTVSLPYYDAIVETYLQADNTWTKPEIAPFSGKYDEFDPLFTPDGKRLYFSSHRPKDGGTQMGKSNIWFVERQGNQWSAPVHLPLTDRGDYFSSISQSGNIYFNTYNPDRNTDDLFKAEKTANGYVVEVLDTVINSMQWEGDPFISPQEDYIIFRSYQNDGLGQGDLYISFKEEVYWTSPINLGTPINSSAHEMCPYVSVDGQYFVFASSRLQKSYYDNPPENLEEVAKKYDSWDNAQQNIYIMSASFIEDLRPQ